MGASLGLRLQRPPSRLWIQGFWLTIWFRVVQWYVPVRHDDSLIMQAQLTNKTLNLDPTDLEETMQVGNVSVAYMPSLQEVTHVLLSGSKSLNVVSFIF